MPGDLREKIAAVNARIGALVEDCRGALRGERNFGSEQLRALSEPISEMAPIMARAKELTALQPDIEGVLDIYKQNLRELHTVLEQVRMMLIVRRGQMDEASKHLHAVSGWAAATRLIR